MEHGLSSLLAPQLRREYREGRDQLRVLPRRNHKVLGIAGLGLMIGTLQHDRDIRAIWSDPAAAFEDLSIWIVAAGWLIWLGAAAGELFGSEIISVERGELVLSRGVGPLRRASRYSINEIVSLCSDGPVGDQVEEPTYRPLFYKSELGAVQFSHRGTIVYFAENLSQADGEKIVQWLRPKLPIKATNSDFR